MNPKEALNALLKEIAGIEGRLGNLSGADRDAAIQEWEGKLQQAEGLQRQAELAEKSAGLRGYMNEPEPGMAIHRGAPRFEGKAGEETVGFAPGGQRRSIDATGWGIGEKAFRAISEPSYKSNFLELLRKGDRVGPTVLKALEEGQDSAGGYLVPADMAGQIAARKPHPTQILGAVSRITTSRDKVQLPKFKYSGDDIYSNGIRLAWTGETGDSSEDTSLENWGLTTIEVHTGSFELHMSRDLVDDAAFDIESWAIMQASQSYQLGLDAVIVNGDGVGKPAGLLRNPNGAEEPPEVNIGNPVTADGLLDLVYGLPPQYAENAVAVCNRTNAYKTFSKLEDGAGNYIFGLTGSLDGGLATARQAKLLGFPILFSAFWEDTGAANHVVGFGDLREAYTLVERLGMTVEPFALGDREMRKANKVGLYFRYRVGGGVVQERAFHIGVQS